MISHYVLMALENSPETDVLLIIPNKPASNLIAALSLLIHTSS
jgi:hypothetical protein